MNASFLCLALALSAGSSDSGEQYSYGKLSDPDIIFRGQNSTYDELPDSGSSGSQFDTSPGQFGSGGIPNNNANGAFQPAPLGQDPFLGGAYGAPSPYLGQGNPYGGAAPGMIFYGANGAQPYRMGWTQRYDFGYLFGQKVTNSPGMSGDMSVFEFDAEWEYTTLLSNGWIFSFTQEYGLRLWDGPLSNNPPPPDRSLQGLPSKVHRIGWDFQLATPKSGPWSMQFNFNPSLNSDFNQSITSNAMNWDGSGMLFFQASPNWMWAGGVAYWDRVRDQLIPIGGFVWTPNDIWEFRMIFPKPRISVFLGNYMGAATWAYTSLEYQIEAYEVELTPGLGRDKIQLEDWRLVGGFRQDYGALQTFIEGGWVFNRDATYLKGARGFDISSGAIVRGGLRF